MKKFNKKWLTVFEHYGLAGSIDFTIPIYMNMNNCEQSFLHSEHTDGEKYIYSRWDYDYDLMNKKMRSGNVRVFATHHGPLSAKEVIAERNGNVNLLLNWRDPINRELSRMAYFSMFEKKLVNKQNINYFMPNNNDFIKTLLKRHSIEYTEINDELYEKVVEIIEGNYFLVMLTEFFAESLYLLAKNLDLDVSEINYPLIVYTPDSPRKTDLFQFHLKKLQNENSYDIRLYEYVKNALINQVNALTEEQKAELKKFKERNNALIKKQKLLGSLRVPYNVAYFTEQTEEYLENKYPGFFEKLAEWNDEDNNDSRYSSWFSVHNRNTTDSEINHLYETLTKNTEYVIINANGKLAYQIARSIDIINCEKQASISLPYMLVDVVSNEIRDKVIFDIPVYPLSADLVKNKNIIIAGFDKYYEIEKKLLLMGTRKNNIINWMGGYKKPKLQKGDYTHVFYISGESAEKVVTVIYDHLHSLGIKPLILSAGELRAVLGGDEYIAEKDIIQDSVMDSDYIIYMEKREETIIYCCPSVPDEVSRRNRNQLIGYYEVYLENDIVKPPNPANPDLIIQNCSKYNIYELAFIIIIEHTHFICQLKLENK